MKCLNCGKKLKEISGDSECYLCACGIFFQIFSKHRRALLTSTEAERCRRNLETFKLKVVWG